MAFEEMIPAQGGEYREPAFDLADISEQVDAAQAMLDKTNPNDPNIGLICEKACHELDKLWRYRGETFQFSGIGVISSLMADEQFLQPPLIDLGDREGQSTGFSTIVLPAPEGTNGQKRHVITYQFTDHKSGVLCVLDVIPQGSTIRHYQPLETVLDMSESDMVLEMLKGKSDGFAQYVAGYEFLTREADLQADMIRACLSNARAEAEATRPTINQDVHFTAQKVYVRNLAKQGAGMVRHPLAQSLAYLGGTIVGIDVPYRQRVEMDIPVESVEDLGDPEAGLWFVIQPNPATSIALGLDNEQALFVPISGQNLSVTFMSDVEFANIARQLKEEQA